MKRYSAAIVLIAIGLAVAAYLRLGSAVPSGQDPLVTLSASNFAEFVAAFDGAPDGPRLVLLLSPT